MRLRQILQLASAMVIVAAGLLFVSNFTEPTHAVLDHHNYQVAIDGMRAGQSYYAAYDVGFREVYGPPPATRDVRMPTLYVALSLLPAGSEHIAYAVIAVLGGVVTIALAKFPPSGILVTAYLLILAVADNGAAQYLYAEFWIAPMVIGAVFALDRGHDVAAVTLATLLFAVREQGILLLAGIGLYLWLRRRHRFSVGVLVALAACGYVVHSWAVGPYLDPENGVHTPLHLGWEPFNSLMGTLGFGLGVWWIGAISLVGAFWWAHRHRLMLAIGPYLAIPILTLWANRPYWGVMVVPLTVVLSIDLIWELVVERESLSQTGVASPLQLPL